MLASRSSDMLFTVGVEKARLKVPRMLWFGSGE